MNNYVRVAAASPYNVSRCNVKQSTSDRLLILKKELGLNLKEANFNESVRRDFRRLNNIHLAPQN